MKKLCTFFAAFIMWSMQTALATNVSGTISTNSTWSLAGSPYIVTSSITINPGVTLTIASGVTVKFDDNQYMYAYGTLTATNTIFTSNNASPTPGIWGTIQTGSSSSGTVNLTGCSIQYAQYFNVYKGTATLNTTDLMNFSQYGASIGSEGTLNMTGGNINTNSSSAASYGSGIYSSGTAGGSATLTNVTIQRFAYGIFLNNINLTLNSCSITNCTWPIYYSSPSNLTVTGTNTFTGNTNTAAYVSDMYLSNTMTLPTLTIPYYFPSGMTVSVGGRLNIGSNNILKFSDYTALNVNGTLSANANIGENIYFTSYRDDNWGGDSNKDGSVTAPASGIWYGVIFREASIDANCLMRRCKVRYAGYGSYGGISMVNASPTIDECDISNNYYGIYMQEASNPVITNNTVGSSKMTPIAMSFEANPILTNNTLSFSDNTYDAIGLIGGTLTANATLKVRSVTSIPNITYLMLDQIIIPSGKSLTINKGVVIKSYTGYYNKILVNGTLTANATADSMITFTSAKDDNYGNPGDSNKDGTITSPVIGDCGGIVFNPGSSGTLNYCRIKYASIYNYGFTTCSTTEYVNSAAVAMIDASPTISNCEFKDLTYGISCYRASNPILSDNNMINIQYTPFCISGSSNPVFTGNTFTNVGWRAIGLLGGNVCQNGTIKKRNVAGYNNITYVLLADMTINSGTNINVDPGVVIKVNYASINVDGGFKTDGTATDKVVFTSLQDDNEGNPFDSNGDGNAMTPTAGNWGSVKFRSTSDDVYCVLNYTTLKYAGYTSFGGVTFENASGKIKNSTLSNSSSYGVYCNGNSTPVIENTIIQNCSLDPIAMSLTSNPTFTNISFLSNFSQAIKIIEGTLSSNAILSSRDVAGITNIAYVIDQLTISSNAKLTIQPGVVIKIRSTYYWANNIVVNGNLIANGLPLNKIYFTSFSDDSKGGDSNNNGNATVPARGEWGSEPYGGGIRFVNNSIESDTVNTMKYCEISYAAKGIQLENSHATIENCVIQQANCGAGIVGSANPTFKDCAFFNITSSPVELSMFSNPTFTNCTAQNVGYMALAVIPETYSQSATVPVRNFGGYTNISYFLKSACTINSGTTITIPAGVVFKSTYASGFTVNGRLDVLGTTANPVVFTNDRDDTYGNPKDMNQDGSASVPPKFNLIYNYGEWGGTWISFNDVSDDLSTIRNVIFQYGTTAISTISASPTIDGARFENLSYGIDMNGVSAPKIDNCTFHNLYYYPMQISLVSYPASTLNNTISGTTYKVIKVKDETLTQDVTIPKRDFGGVTNIPYCFGNYTIGTGATLTINPGIVSKFLNYGQININKGLLAIGGSSPDNTIVFTSIRDDFYGGDSNSDSTFTTPATSDWYGIAFQSQSLDPLCKLDHCIVRFANQAIQTISASPTVENSNISKNYYGVYATAASNPVFTNCDFDDNYYFAIDNVDKSFVIDAKNCWWGSNLGPVQTNTYGNGTSIRELVTDAVNYTPWKTTGAGNPLMGDVSLNGMVQAYDAALILQSVVGSITLDSYQQQVADVSAAAGITAYDASLILQYVVGLNRAFPAELKKADLSALTYPQLTVGSANAEKGQDVSIPLSVNNVSGMVAAEIKLQYDPAYLRVSLVTKIVSEMNLFYSVDSIHGILTIAMAGPTPLISETILAQVTFNIMESSGNSKLNTLTVAKFIANETDMTSGVINGSITTSNYATGIYTNKENVQAGMLSVYPNPSFGNAMLSYQLDVDNRMVNIEVYNLTGQKVVTLVNEPRAKGRYLVSIKNKGSSLDCGSYIIRMTMDGFSQSQKFLIVR